uniref:Glycosyltransferase family 1 protein n=1 Tax=candidate division CPR3 bacterium TaxID=2268181 RepID=A0A7C4R5I2_UNCC3
MIIGIDASRINIKRATGVEGYSTNLLLWLKKIDFSEYKDGGKYHNQYNLYTPQKDTLELMDLPKNFNIVEIPFPRLWTQLRLGFELKKRPPHIFFVPSHVAPIIPFKSKKIITIHDVAYKYFPESYSVFSRNYLDFTTKWAVKNADKIITISHTTKDDLVKFYQADEKKIKVIYLGFNPDKIKKEEINKEKWRIISDKFKIEKPFLLYIGRIEHKKNIANLIKSFYEILSKGFDIQLVLAGSRGFGYDKIDSLITKYNLQDRVVLTNYVSEEEKNHLLHSAKLFVFLSRYEGFGIPVLESFYAGLPVVASKIPVFEELYGEASLLVNPYKTEEISVEIIKLLKNENRQQKMIEKGKEIAKRFSWERCAKETLELFCELDKEKIIEKHLGISGEYAKQYKEMMDK